MGIVRNRKRLADVLEEMDAVLTEKSKTAASIGDAMLVYLLDMAVLHVRTNAIHVVDKSEEVAKAMRSQRRVVAREPVGAAG